MRLFPIKDMDYIRWLWFQPCVTCGHIPNRGRFFRWDSGKEKWRWERRRNVAHHVGDGIRTKKNNDYYAVPVCDNTGDPKGNNCHHAQIHKHMNHWEDALRQVAERLQEEYEHNT